MERIILAKNLSPVQVPTTFNVERHWQISQAVHCIGQSNCSCIRQTLSRVDVLLLMGIFWSYPGLKVLFEYNGVHKSFFQMHVVVGMQDFLFMRRTKNSNLLELLLMGTRKWSSFFVNSKCLDYIQCCMMMLQQFWQVVAKVQATVLDSMWLKFLFAWSRDLNTLLPSRKSPPTFDFELGQLLKQYVLRCTRYWVDRYKH